MVGINTKSMAIHWILYGFLYTSPGFRHPNITYDLDFTRLMVEKLLSTVHDPTGRTHKINSRRDSSGNKEVPVYVLL